MPQQEQHAYQPYQSIRHSVEAIGGKSISAVDLGRTSLEMIDSIHALLILLLRHHEDIMMRLEELKREKAANEDMEVFTDERRTQIFHIQIEGFTKLNTWISGCRKQKRGKAHTRDSPRSKNLVRFCMFLFLTTRILKEIWICTRHLATDVSDLSKVGKLQIGHQCHVWQTSTYTLFWFRLAAWLSIFSRSTSRGSPWPNTFKHAKKRYTPSRRRTCCWSYIPWRSLTICLS